MSSIKDLEPCNYFPLECEALVAIGWLGRESEYPKGPVSIEFFNKLSELCKKPWEPIASAGLHVCELCQFEAPSFSANLFVPYSNRIFVAPVGVVHYIAAHWYKPPGIFVEAVMFCPVINSMEYKKAMLSNGGRSLVKSMA
jgi:hypothetical protein